MIKLRIGIAGFGRMGKIIHQKALNKGCEVPVVIDPDSKDPLVTSNRCASIMTPLDVIIDFTHPEAVIKNIECYGELNIPAVIGTTGWYDQLDHVTEVVERSGIGLIWSGNFSLGVNLFFKIVENAAEIINHFSQYDAAIHECHHRYKADSPSGTAEMLGDIIVNKLANKDRIVNALDENKIKENELHISSTRAGSIPGNHQVLFDSDTDTITLEHRARNREGFAEGALLAADWICGKKGLYNINDMMQSIFGGVDNR
ncbi:MAG: 4-hydroxy-tetrahydrodipicolinate reductase [Bacillota bacterium]